MMSTEERRAYWRQQQADRRMLYPEAERARHREWYARNQEAIRARKRERYATDAEYRAHVLAVNAASYRRNR